MRVPQIRLEDGGLHLHLRPATAAVAVQSSKVVASRGDICTACSSCGVAGRCSR